MLRELHISNLAVIADAKVEFAPGLNCFTGATGAGKSLVIGAIEVLLGLRSPSEMLRPDAAEGRVSGVFHVVDPESLKRIDRATDVPVTREGGELLLTRRLYASGRSSVSLNGHPITLGMLKAAAEHLVDVHGQHDHQYLLKPSNQLDTLDQYGGLSDLRRAYYAVYEQLQDATRKLAELAGNRSLRDQQLDLYRFQADEIDKAELDAKEYEELGARASVLKNLEKLTKDATATHRALYEADGSVLERLKMMAGVLADLATLDQNLKPVATNLRDATINLEEVAFDLSRYLDKLDLDPAEAAEIEDRLNTINRVVNKYGRTVEDALAHRADVGRQIAELERATEDLSSLRRVIHPLTRELKKVGDELTARRAEVARSLAPQIEAALSELGMEKARFTIEVKPLAAEHPAIATTVARSAATATTTAQTLAGVAGKSSKSSAPAAQVNATSKIASPAAPARVAPKSPTSAATLPGAIKLSTPAAPLSAPANDSLPDVSHATPHGFDAVEFVAQTNPGLAPQPLRKIASGGEMSRIMLALKGILAAGDRVSVLVFDEIDANVGGRLGSVIGNKLRQLARHHQVLCITHLPQIACYGDRHLTVRKESVGNDTRTTVRVMDGPERLQEIAEMIGGHRVTETTLAQAKELLDAAGQPPPASGATARCPPAPPAAAADAKRPPLVARTPRVPRAAKR